MTTNILLFLNLGGGEVVVIMLVILLFFGSKKIPDLARGLGRGMREFKDAMSGVERELQKSMNETSASPEKKEAPKTPDTPNTNSES